MGVRPDRPALRGRGSVGGRLRVRPRRLDSADLANQSRRCSASDRRDENAFAAVQTGKPTAFDAMRTPSAGKWARRVSCRARWVGSATRRTAASRRGCGSLRSDKGMRSAAPTSTRGDFGQVLCVCFSSRRLRPHQKQRPPERHALPAFIRIQGAVCRRLEGRAYPATPARRPDVSAEPPSEMQSTG